MRVEVLRHRWAVLGMAAAVFATGCATLPPPADEEMAAGQKASAEPATQSPPSCGGQPVPEGWPEYSTWGDEELLAPFFQCTSPAEFLELQRRVDMPRLVEALKDWSAVRLGALGPLDGRAAQVLQRKRFSFLVNATQRYGAYAQVLTLFLVDTAFDDEVRELLVLLAQDKQLEQALWPMESVREQLERRGFKLTDYREREARLRDVVRGLGRAVDDVASTIPIADGARGGGVFATRAHLPPPYQEAFDETERALMREHFAPGHVVLGSFDAMTFGVPLGFYYLVVGTGHGVYTLAQGRYEQATRELTPAALMVGMYAGGKRVRYLSEAKAAGAGERGVRLQVPELRLQALKEVVERLRERLGEQGLRQLVRHLQSHREAAVLVAAGGEPAAVALYEARGDLTQAQAVLSQAKPEPGGPTLTRPGAREPLGGVTSPKGALPTETPIRNAHLAGQRHPVTGVPFDADGYPDFKAAGVVKAEVRITYTGSRARDFAAANQAAGLRETPKGMTWHHHQDQTTMQLVPTEIHAKTGHTGGFSGDP